MNILECLIKDTRRAHKECANKKKDIFDKKN